MAQITEDYVSFETAKLLKEKWFDESIRCFTVYNNDGKFYDTRYGIAPSVEIPAPTLQMAMKWLREEHNIQVVVSPYNTLDKTWSYHMFRNFEALTQRFYIFKTYEESCEAAIKYCLENLI